MKTVYVVYIASDLHFIVQLRQISIGILMKLWFSCDFHRVSPEKTEDTNKLGEHDSYECTRFVANIHVLIEILIREILQMRMRLSIHANVQTFAYGKVHKNSYQNVCIANKMCTFVRVICP